MKLRSKLAIVTGGGSGIGRSIALMFSEQGAKVGVVVDRDMKSAEDTVALIRQNGGEAIAIRADVSQKGQVIEMKERFLREYGSIDILVNNASILTPPVPIEDLPEEDWDRLIAVDLKGTFLCSQIIGKEMINRKKGCIINIASVTGHAPYAMAGAYSPSKAAILLLTQQLALEFSKYNIRVNSISPGLIRTPLTENVYADKEIYEKRVQLVPSHRIGDPEDIARAALFLASEDASYINGVDILVDGGLMNVLFQLVPGRAGNK